ncbi:hypothetical protein EW145_g1648 [Phellinidium pouzarii]|uniref:Uncharacterized protein n=1 Tax=Phellinidium pouzarii TaxID=167371 RepID=A0A4S4LE74_9AGAM|nr:hypothetical protein EW145_g1648 [Phellinidium pouzarii]
MERATLINAVLYSDASRIDSSLVTDIDQESPLPDAVPNTHTDEQSFSSLPSANIVPPQDLEPAPRSRLGKRIAPSSRETTPAMDMKPTSVQPVAVLPEEQAAPLRASEEPEVSARKRLVRRARTNAAPPPILGVGDPSFLFSQTPELESLAVVPVADAPIVEKPSSSSSALITRSSRLKKRARAEAPLNPILANLEQEIAEATTQQPPLKRFKALFDETDPDRAASQVSGSGAFSGGIIDSQMFSQLPTESGGIGMSEPGLDAVPEEVEETLPEQVTRAREAGKVQVINDDLEDEGPLSPRKKQHKSASAVAVPTPSQTQKSHAPFSSTQDKVRASSKVGAAPGKPDTDAAFLKALASTKKGKRQEDDFDREFNQLRISKPELDNEAEDWRVLADFGDESNLMGNFMVIVEMDVPMSRASSRAQSKDPERSEWRGKQDFKKFKKKSSAYQRPCVQLVAEDGNDYGMGNAYWKGGSQGQSQSDAVSQNELGTAQQPALSKPSQTRNRGFLEPASGPSTLNANPRSRSQSQSRAKTSQAKTQKSGLRSKSRSLQVVSEEESDDDRQPEKNGKAGANGKAKGKNEPLFLEEESVEDVGGAVLGGEEIDVDLDLDLDLDGVSDEDFGEPMLRSTAKPDAAVIKSMSSKATVASKRSATSKKRSSALMDDDDSDTGMAFKGFTGRKKAKAY